MSQLSQSDEWQLQAKDFKELTTKYNFKPTLDVCATKKNKQCDRYYSKRNNALTQRWDSKNWCNAPAHFYKEFVRKAHEEFIIHGNETMLILPANSICTAYAGKHIIGIAEFYPIIGRYTFLHYGKKLSTARNAYFVVIWRRHVTS